MPIGKENGMSLLQVKWVVAEAYSGSIISFDIEL